MRRPALRASLLGCLMPACLMLAACQDAPAPPVAANGAGRSDAATQAACRAHADQVYDERNRADIYAPLSSVNTPYSANYTPGVTNRGLADLYARDSLIRDCVRNTGTETSRDVPPPPATGAVNRP